MKQSLRARLIWILAAAFLPAAIFLGWQWWNNAQLRLQNFQQQSLALSQQLASRQGQLIEQSKPLLKLLASEARFYVRDVSTCEAWLRELLKQDFPYSNYGTPQADGTLLCTALPLPGPVNVADRPYIQAALQSQDFSIGEYQIDRVAHHASINMAYPIKQDGSNISHLMVAVLPLKKLQEILARLSLGEQWQLSLLDKNFDLLVQLPESSNLTLGKPPLATEQLQALQHAAAQAQLYQYQQDGQTWLATLVPLPLPSSQPALYLLAQTPREHLLAPVLRELRNKGLLLLTTLVGCFLLIGWGMERGVLRHVRALHQQADHLSRRYTGSELPSPSSGNEVHQLQRHFQALVKRIELEWDQRKRQEQLTDQLSQTTALALRANNQHELLEGIGQILVQQPQGIVAVLFSSSDRLPGYAPIQASYYKHSPTQQSMQLSLLGVPTHQPLFIKAMVNETLLALGESQGAEAFVIVPVRHHALQLVALAEHYQQLDRPILRMLEDICANLELALNQLAQAESLNQQLSGDRLTGLLTKRGFLHHLSLVHAHSPLLVVVARVDNYAALLSLLGYAGIDDYVIHLSLQLQGLKPRLLARLHQDSFALAFAIERTPEHTLAQLQQAWSGQNWRSFEIHGQLCYPNLVLGVSTDLACQEPERMLLRAEAAAAQTRNQEQDFPLHCYSEEQVRQLGEQERFETELRQALEQGQLELYYQSIHSAIDGQVKGYEALLRWQHPREGLISPAIFIPLAERNGLIHPLGRWVIQRLLSELPVLAGLHSHPISLSFNLAAPQLLHPQLLVHLEEMLKQHQPLPTHVKLAAEITETSLISHFDQALPVLEQLRELGIDIYLDDFGCGYSSLSYLHRFPCDQVKLDMSFIRDLPHQARVGAIVQGMIGLVHKLGHPVVAEGVEHEAQRLWLAQQHCDGIQGYLFAKPQPLATLLANTPSALE
ncbi:EAL domain-containing protein [Balneatrix alpica]|uniref:EAL domain-containing protein n=1 Tax=Balneatrix alpica TaxID=75684 RepID=UPI002738CD27|nr:EAL domain-containing protein [Balneatrix alpica]